MADDDGAGAQARRRSAPAAPGRPGRGRWSARRAGRRRSGRAAARRGRRGPPGRRRARSSAGPGRRSGRGRRRPPRPARRGRRRRGRASAPGASAYASSAPGAPSTSACGGRVHRRAGRRPTPVRRARNVAHGLARRGAPAPAAGGRRWRWAGTSRSSPCLGRSQPGEQPQQRGLAGAVGADQADHVAGRDDEVEPGEEGAVAVAGGEVLGDEGGSHQEADPTSRPDRSARRVARASGGSFTGPSAPPARFPRCAPR